MAFDLYVYDAARNVLGILGGIVECLWREQYNGLGEVSVQLIYSPEAAEMLKIGHMLWRNPGQTVCEIEALEFADSAENPYIIARGRIGADIAKRMVAGDAAIMSAEVDTLALVADNLRGLPVEIAAPSGLVGDTDYTSQWANLADAVTAAIAPLYWGWRISWDAQTRIKRFELYQGEDRRAGAAGYVGELSDVNGSVTAATWSRDYSVFRNYAIVRGADDTVFFVTLSEMDAETRRETTIDLSSVKKTYTKEVNTGEEDEEGNPIIVQEEIAYTDAEYQALIEERALDTLRAAAFTNDINILLAPSAMMEIDRDFFLGDLLTFRHHGYGLTAECRITSVTYTQDDSGFNAVVGVTFERGI